MVERTKYENNGWPEYQKLILYRLDELKEHQEDVIMRLGKLEVCVAGLKVFVRVKAGLWGSFGALAAMVTAAAAWAMFFQDIGG